MKKIVPWVIPIVFLGCLAAAAIVPELPRDGFRIAEFARLPVVMNSRVQPIDSVARAALQQIRGTATVPIERTGPWRPWQRQPSLSRNEWLLELMTMPDTADSRRVFPVRDSALIAALHLDGGAGYYTLAELRPHFDVLARESERIKSAAAASRASWETECLKLRDAVALYDRLKNTLQPNSAVQAEARGKAVTYPFASLLAQYQRDIRGVVAPPPAPNEKPVPPDIASMQRVDAFARPFLTVSRAAMFGMVPPDESGKGRDQWLSIGDSVSASTRTGQISPAVRVFAVMSSAYAQHNAAAFNDALAQYRRWMTQRNRTLQLARPRDEFFYMNFQPYARALSLYLVAGALLGIAWGFRSQILHRAALRLTVIACLVHLGGIIVSAMIQGRLPMMNAYGRIVVLGLMAVVAAGIAGWRRRNDTGALAAAAVGVLTLGIAQAVAPGGLAELSRVSMTMGFGVAVAITAIAVALSLRRQDFKASAQTKAVRLAAA